MYILGISAFYHDSAACLVKDGVIVAAMQEERFTRKKHDECFPKNAVEYCLKEGGVSRLRPQRSLVILEGYVGVVESETLDTGSHQEGTRL